MTKLYAGFTVFSIVILGLIAGCKKDSKGTVGGNATGSRADAASSNGPGGPDKAPIGGAQNARTHVDLYKKTLAVTKELAELLASIKDEAGAKAARRRFDELQDEAVACAQRMQQLGPHPAGLGDPYLPDIKRYSAQLQDEWLRIGADPAMKAALERLRI